MIPLRHHQPLSKQRSARKVDLNFEIRFFEGIVRRDRHAVEALQILGDAYTKSGRWRDGLAIDRKLARLCPTDPTVFYNLACSYSLLRKVTLALASLEKAIRLGYSDARWLARDPDLRNIRSDPRFRQLCARVARPPRRRRS